MKLANYPKFAYNYAFGILVTFEVLLLLWMLINIKKLLQVRERDSC